MKYIGQTGRTIKKNMYLEHNMNFFTHDKTYSNHATHLIKPPHIFWPYRRNYRNNTGRIKKVKKINKLENMEIFKEKHKNNTMCSLMSPYRAVYNLICTLAYQ